MKIVRLRLFFLVILGCLAAGIFAPAEALDVGKVSSLQLEKIFKSYGYDNYLLKPEWKYPEIIVKSWPEGYTEIKSEMQQRRFFMMILLPMALKINQEIKKERQVLEYLIFKNAKSQLDDTDKFMIDDFAKKYDAFTRESGQKRYDLLLEVLMSKVNAVPPSVFVAAAAINTDWGNAPFLPLSNNLYRELNWYTDEGLKPLDDKNAAYRIKVFDSLYDSMKSFALALNSGVNTDMFRYMRQLEFENHHTILGKDLAPYLIFVSEIENFAGLMDYIITFYKLNEVDKLASLSSDLIVTEN